MFAYIPDDTEYNPVHWERGPIVFLPIADALVPERDPFSVFDSK